MFNRLKSFDAYPKLHEELQVRTMAGAGVSIVAIGCIVILFCSELALYLNTEVQDRLFVDTTMGKQLQINFDITFPHIPCSLLSLDAMDVSGISQLDVKHHVKKKPLVHGSETGQEIVHVINDEHADGTNQTHPHHEDEVEKAKERVTAPGYCGSCYGAAPASQCCNTCDEVRKLYHSRKWALNEGIEQCVASGDTHEIHQDALKRGDGCRASGYLEVAKVAGNFHFAPGKSFARGGAHVHDIATFPPGSFNVTHTIHHLSFGEHYPGILNPLDNVSRIELYTGPLKTVPDSKPKPPKVMNFAMMGGNLLETLEDFMHQMQDDVYQGGMFMYYTKIVPTTYNYISGKAIITNQYSVTERYKVIHSHESNGLPGVFVFYELSPIMVEVQEKRQSFFHFLTQLCAIVGGVFTVAGMVDKFIYGAMCSLEKKIEIGKFT